jgi:hypothetical protein
MNNELFLQYGKEMLEAERDLRTNQRKYKVGLRRGNGRGSFTQEVEALYEAYVLVSWEGVQDGMHVVNVVPHATSGVWPSDKAVDQYRAIRAAAEKWAQDPFASELPPSGPWENA